MKKIIVVVLISSLVVVGLFIWKQQPSNLKAKQEAIRQAQEFHPSGMCTDSFVPAVHKATGAKYTFSNGCLAPGWEPER